MDKDRTLTYSFPLFPPFIETSLKKEPNMPAFVPSAQHRARKGAAGLLAASQRQAAISPSLSPGDLYIGYPEALLGGENITVSDPRADLRTLNLILQCVFFVLPPAGLTQGTFPRGLGRDGRRLCLISMKHLITMHLCPLYSGEDCKTVARKYLTPTSYAL